MDNSDKSPLDECVCNDADFNQFLNIYGDFIRCSSLLRNFFQKLYNIILEPIHHISHVPLHNDYTRIIREIKTLIDKLLENEIEPIDFLHKIDEYIQGGLDINEDIISHIENELRKCLNIIIVYKERCKDFNTIPMRVFSNSLVLSEEIKIIPDELYKWNIDLEILVLKPGLEKISSKAFAFSGIKGKIIIPDTVKIIEEGVFIGCKNITSVVLPKNLEYLGERVFADCSNLKSIEIPGSIINIKNITFYNCIRLENVVLSNGIQKISSHAFCCCYNLRTINIPKTVSEINCSSFSFCKNLESIELKFIKKLGVGSFANCYKLKEISIPSIDTIPPYSFYNCNNLLEIRMDDNIKKIGIRAFGSCYSLRYISISKLCKEVEVEAFINCKLLKNVLLPHADLNFKDIFKNCNSIENMKNTNSKLKSKMMKKWFWCKDTHNWRFTSKQRKIIKTVFFIINRYNNINQYMNIPMEIWINILENIRPRDI